MSRKSRFLGIQSPLGISDIFAGFFKRYERPEIPEGDCTLMKGYALRNPSAHIKSFHSPYSKRQKITNEAKL